MKHIYFLFIYGVTHIYEILLLVERAVAEGDCERLNSVDVSRRIQIKLIILSIKRNR